VELILSVRAMIKSNII